MSEDKAEKTDRAARAICAEQCAHFGDPPCWQIGAWPNENCDEPGCIWLARVAVDAMDEAGK